jgi:hypothetical protein
MHNNKIQLPHPIAGKKNKAIALEKNQQLKDAILQIFRVPQSFPYCLYGINLRNGKR